MVHSEMKLLSSVSPSHKNAGTQFITNWKKYLFESVYLPSVLWHCWLGGRKGIRPVKNWVVGCWRGCLGWGADLHIAQQMPLPLTISCSSKSRLVLTFLVLPFWYLLTRVVPDIFQKSSKTVVCVCVCVCVFIFILAQTPCFYISLVNELLMSTWFYTYQTFWQWIAYNVLMYHEETANSLTQSLARSLTHLCDR